MSFREVYEKFTYTDENRVGYDELAKAVVLQALNDYRIASLRLYDDKYNTSDYSKAKCLMYIQEVPRFLTSQQFTMFSDTDGNMLLDYMNKFIKEECEV